MSGDDDLIELDLELHDDDSAKDAILVSDDGNRETAVWLPRSQISIFEESPSLISVEMPEWLAMEKGLI